MENSPSPTGSLTERTFDAILNEVQDDLLQSEFLNEVKYLSSVFYTWYQDNSLSQLLIEGSSKGNASWSDSMKEEDMDIICYGLGKFFSSRLSLYQLGFLLILKDILPCSQVYIYDPQFSDEEIAYLGKLRFHVISTNEKGKRTFYKKTLCFMPHCDLHLYNNLLWANWKMENLSNLAILGNSLKGYERDDGILHLQENASYVFFANQFATEVQIRNNFRYGDIFNHLSFHWFASKALSLVEEHVWTYLEEPQYDDFVCSHMENNSNDSLSDLGLEPIYN